MVLVQGWLPPSRENWSFLVFLWQFFPLVSLFLLSQLLLPKSPKLKEVMDTLGYTSSMVLSQLSNGQVLSGFPLEYSWKTRVGDDGITGLHYAAVYHGHATRRKWHQEFANGQLAYGRIICKSITKKSCCLI